jgi:hypothetical protein
LGANLAVNLGVFFCVAGLAFVCGGVQFWSGAWKNWVQTVGAIFGCTGDRNWVRTFGVSPGWRAISGAGLGVRGDRGWCC